MFNDALLLLSIITYLKMRFHVEKSVIFPYTENRKLTLGDSTMRKILLALFICIIVTVGVIGYNGLSDEPTEVIEEKSTHSTEIQL